MALARQRLGAFVAWVSPWWEPALHHRRICEALERVEAGQCRRLLIQMPPRSGKSELFSVHFPAWYIGRNPDRRLIHAAYGADLSNTFSRRVRNLVRDDERFRSLFPGVTISGDAQSVTQWELSNSRGGFRSVGVGGGITGHGADLALIDDPVKGAEAAESAVQRDAVWQWYTSELVTRLHPDAAVVLGMTRWHEDDLAGRILASEGNRWEVLSLPAINESGQPLWPERYGLDALREIEASVGSRVWQALYQQRPTGDSGLEFRAEWFDPWTTLPPITEAWTRWDTALKDAERNDRTAYLTVARGKDGLLYGVDGAAGHWSGDQIEAAMLQVYSDNRKRFGSLYRGEYMEDAAAGALMIQRYRDPSGGKPVVIPVDTPRVSKLIRARGVAPLVEARKFRPPAVGNWWSDVFLPEITGFPLAAHDDCLDVFVGALERYATTNAPSATPTVVERTQMFAR